MQCYQIQRRQGDRRDALPDCGDYSTQGPGQETWSLAPLGRYLHHGQDPTARPVSCEIDGKTYWGTYWVAGKILTVSTGVGGKSTQVGSTQPEILAEQLLRKLAKEGKA